MAIGAGFAFAPAWYAWWFAMLCRKMLLGLAAPLAVMPTSDAVGG